MKIPKTISLDHGSGGLASQHLISDLFLKYLSNPVLDGLEDCAILEQYSGRIAMSTDSYVVDPLFFPGGNIGELAVNGTINDLAMRGARPVALSLGLIIEEGFSAADLEKIIAAIAKATDQAGVDIVTGDTKVVPRGKADKIFINTTGVGVVSDKVNISGKNAQPGNVILVSGTIGDHGITIMANQAGLAIDGDIKSDTMALHTLVDAILQQSGDSIRVLRDPTRGGLATSLCEIASASAVSLAIEEDKLPIRSQVNAACELIGLDPLYLANEGKCIVICDQEKAEATLACMRSMAQGEEAAIIGRVIDDKPGRVTLTTCIGGSRLIEPLTGHPLPRIC